MPSYFGTYHRFETASKNDGVLLTGADNFIGDEYEIVFKEDTAWMKNRFDALVGFFDKDFSRQLRVMDARGWKIKALLAIVAYTDHPEPGNYWGEAAVLAYDPAHAEAFDAFAAGIAKTLGEGIRPEINLGEQAIEKVISSKGAWVPEQRSAFTGKEAGTVVMKSRRKMSEKLIEEGRKGNKGCYFVSIAFIVVVVAALLYLISRFFL